MIWAWERGDPGPRSTDVPSGGGCLMQPSPIQCLSPLAGETILTQTSIVSLPLIKFQRNSKWKNPKRRLDVPDLKRERLLLVCSSGLFLVFSRALRWSDFRVLSRWSSRSDRRSDRHLDEGWWFCSFIFSFRWARWSSLDDHPDERDDHPGWSKWLPG